MITKKEHDRRIRLTEKVLGPIGDKVDGIILVGSMAYGTIDSLRPDSDVDVICVRSFKRVQELAEVKDLEAGLSDEMVQVTSEGKCNTFTIDVRKDGVTIALHFWDYSALERIITLNGNNTRYIPNEAHVTPNKTLQGFTGKQLTDYAPDHRLKRGYIREFPVAVEGVDDIYLFVQPRNLILQPRILHDSHIQLAERIDVFWKYLAAAYCKKFRAYNPEKPLMNTIPESIQRKLPRRAKEQIEQNFILEIAKLPR